jgi:hypothetical protein
MNLSTLLEELLVVIVLYRRRAGESATYLSLLEAQKGLETPAHILFYDNSPVAEKISGKHIDYIHDPRNSGISTAYNSASKYAEKRGKNWLLFLDQDSILPVNFFAHLSSAAKSRPETQAFVPRVYDKMGLLSPFRFRSARGTRINLCPETLPLSGYRFINSGLFIRTSAFVSAGGYDEDIPLDFSDISFGSKLKKITNHVGVIPCDVHHDFAGSRAVPVDDALNRYEFYCTGALRLGKKTSKRLSLGFQAIARAAHLSCRYRDKRFLKTFFRQIAYD